MTYVIRRACLAMGIAATVLAMLAQAQETPAPAVNLESDVAQQCYAAGAMIGKSIAEPGVELDVEAFIAGFTAALKGQELAMEEMAMSAKELLNAPDGPDAPPPGPSTRKRKKKRMRM